MWFEVRVGNAECCLIYYSMIYYYYEFEFHVLSGNVKFNKYRYKKIYICAHDNQLGTLVVKGEYYT